MSATPSTAIRRPLVAVIGDGRIAPGSPKQQIAHDLGRAIVEAGWRVLTGGLGGVMEAACRGAHDAATYAPGDTIAVLPGGDARPANRWVDVALPTGLGHSRNGLVAHADAIVAVGGGAGTLAEIAFAWIHDRPIVALRVEGWSGRLADTRLDDRPRHPDIPEDRIFGADDAAHAVRLLAGLLPRYRV